MGKILSIDKYSRKKIDLSNLLDINICRLNALFTENGLNLLITGGAVRDHILGNKPNDIDFTTDANPDEIISKLKNNRDFLIIDDAKKYGCISFKKNEKKYEVTTLREDVNTFGRSADVRFTKDLYKDAMRRDFFCNSMYLSFDGMLYDPLNAYQDTLGRKVSFIGNTFDRIQEDHLRILRYIRFSSKLDSKNIIPEELEVCIKEKALLLRISKERIKSEILKLMQSIKSPEIISALSLREFLGLFDIKINNCTHIPKLASIKKRFDNFFQNPLFEFTLTLDNTVPFDNTLNMLRELRFTNHEIKQIKIFSDLLEQRTVSVVDNIDAYIYKYGREFTGYAVIIFCLFESKKIQNKSLLTLFNSISEKAIPNFPIKSEDILGLGVKPGKDVGLIIKKFEKEWLSSNCQLTKDELLAKINL